MRTGGGEYLIALAFRLVVPPGSLTIVNDIYIYIITEPFDFE